MTDEKRLEGHAKNRSPFTVISCEQSLFRQYTSWLRPKFVMKFLKKRFWNPASHWTVDRAQPPDLSFLINYRSPSLATGDLNDLRLNAVLPTKIKGFELKIMKQPESKHHRPSYASEGSRGPTRDETGQNHPTMQVRRIWLNWCFLSINVLPHCYTLVVAESDFWLLWMFQLLGYAGNDAVLQCFTGTDAGAIKFCLSCMGITELYFVDAPGKKFQRILPGL